ncbi:trypsin-like serine protease [Corynebacterium caspium]|uniref:trypsin-like serine protease n=1 Tax=Corynebacterium caspium TaxID=234828 RepID=UPI00035D9ABC|nr:trypsin-like serine protease [Corynebacterium caspium]
MSTAITPAGAIEGGHEVTDDDTLARNVVQIGACTGTIIAPQWVITAHHCSPVASHNPHINHGLTRPHSKTGSKRYATDRKVRMPYGDILLLHTTEKTTATKFPDIYTGKPESGTKAKVYGWGGGTGARLKYADITVKHLGYGNSGYAGLAILGQYNDGAQARRGDSGGPLFIDGKVAGITSSSAHSYNILVNFAEISPHAELINNTIHAPENGANTPGTAPAEPEQPQPEPQPEPEEQPQPQPLPELETPLPEQIPPLIPEMIPDPPASQPLPEAQPQPQPAPNPQPHPQPQPDNSARPKPITPPSTSPDKGGRVNPGRLVGIILGALLGLFGFASGIGALLTKIWPLV